MRYEVRSHLLDQVVQLLSNTRTVYRGTPAEALLSGLLGRVEEPLRVAIAGKVKAGKSTLLNALVGEELAPTDEGECTSIVTWYRNGITYRVTLSPRGDVPRQVPFSRDHGAIQVNLMGYEPEQVESLTVDWPTSSLARMTLVDTPGIGSLSTNISARTLAFLTPDNDEPTPADAVLYLMRHLHATDINFLEAFHEEEYAQPSPVNAIAVLSRADEIGVGRIESMTSAARIAARYQADPKVRRLAQSVVPVAGLLAQAGASLREAEYRALAVLAAAERSDVELLMLSADRFARAETVVAVAPEMREHLLDRLGLFGIRLSIALLRQRKVQSAAQLATELVNRSGLNELRQVLLTQFTSRRDVLKARSALLAVDKLLSTLPVTGSKELAAEVERIQAGAHEFAELRLLNALRTGSVEVKPAESAEMERLLGVTGGGLAERLGLDDTATENDIRRALQNAIARWQRRAENPMSSRAVADASRVLVRTCEGLFVEFGAS